MVIEIALGVLTLLVAVGTGVYLHFQNPEREDVPDPAAGDPGGEGQGQKAKKKSRKKTSIKDLWGIKDVKKGVVIMTEGRYCIICRMSAADFWLLSGPDQDSIEDAAAAALIQLSFPVQFVTTAQAVDTRAAVEDLRIKAAGLPVGLREMAMQRAEYLSTISKSKTASARQAYLVISFATHNGFEFAYDELQARLMLTASALAGANVSLEILRSEAVVDLLAHILDRGSAWRPSDVVETGGMSLYAVPEKEVVKNVS
jgi:hypothetical protein